MHYDVSMVKRGDWRIGIVLGAEYATRVKSTSETAAIRAAKNKRLREQQTRYKGGVDGKANIDPTWRYCLPDELVPKGKRTAEIMGAAFFVGSACSKHPLNHVRYTSDKSCPICRAESVKGMKR